LVIFAIYDLCRPRYVAGAVQNVKSILRHTEPRSSPGALSYTDYKTNTRQIDVIADVDKVNSDALDYLPGAAMTQMTAGHRAKTWARARTPHEPGARKEGIAAHVS
jgi:hypothetical protein